MKTLKLACPHFPKNFQMTFSCKSTGNYTIELCTNCHNLESKSHLIKEEPIQ